MKNQKMNKDAIRVYLVPDAHYGHKNMEQFCGRPRGFEYKVNTNIKHIVRPQDVIIFLGDVCFSNKDFLISMISDLPGHKILTKGNHDRRSSTWFYNAGFDFVCDEITIGKIVLSHFPIAIPEDKINIHGHFHNVPASRWEPYLVERLTDSHYLCSLEIADYKPILLDTAVERGDVVKSLEFPK
jgi:calcineurin-like phosphoesterase family protein